MAAEAPARFRRELAVSWRGGAAAAAEVEVAGTAASAAEAEAGSAAGVALFQGLPCAPVDVRAGAGEPAVGRRTGSVGRGEAAAAALAEVETEAVHTEAVHFQPGL